MCGDEGTPGPAAATPGARRRGPLGEEARKGVWHLVGVPAITAPISGPAESILRPFHVPWQQLSRARSGIAPQAIPRNPARAVSPVSEDPVDDSFLRALV
jgi:hypothetical protein